MGLFGRIFGRIVPKLISSIGQKVVPKLVGNLATRGVQTLAEKTGVGNVIGEGAVKDASQAVGGMVSDKASNYFQK